eukprot:gene33755-34679_t
MVWAILMTSLGVTVGMNTDLAGVTQELNARSFRTFEFFALAAVIYYIIAKAVTLAARAMASRIDLAFLAQGAAMTLAVTAVSVTAGTLLGILFGVIRVQAGPYWSMPLTFVLDVFRSVPLLIQLVLANAFQSIAKLGW